MMAACSKLCFTKWADSFHLIHYKAVMNRIPEFL